MSEIVFDASALMALICNESGSKTVETHLNDAVISTVNLCEVISKLIKHGMPEQIAISLVSSLGLRIAVFDEEICFKAALLTKETSKFGLSLGDRACLALAQQLNLPVLTADRSWSKPNIDCQIKVLR